MDVATVQDFIRNNHHAVMATFRRDGRPALSPVLVTLDEQDRVVISTRETAMKVQHLRRDPRIAISVFADRFYGDWVQAEGTAEVVSLPEAMEPLVHYYRSISGEHPDWDDYRAAMARDERVLIRFAIERAGPSVAG
ncbi:MAG TPA: PPOX class F420-dependent oxidoreductase [Jatrophihabitans sp.]|nr:PPOX class F420-dependent oxidoreductase [Jatrophihabitans sp.]